MKKSRMLLVAAFLMLTSLASAGTVIFGISADGAQDEFPIGKVQSIKFEPNSKGDKGYPTIVFNKPTSGLESAGAQSTAILVYPNPVSEYITISGAMESDEVLVTDMNGKIVSRTQGSRVSVVSLENGNYVLTIKGTSVRFLKK